MRTAESVVLTDCPPGPGRPVDVDAQVVLVDLDLAGVVDLGEHEHAGRGGVDAALRLRHGDPLHAVHAALVLEVGPDAVLGCHGALGLHGDLDVLVAAEVGLRGLDDLGLPAAPLGVAQVHAQQVAGEQRGLLAALAGLDLEDDVAAVVGVARDEHAAQLLRGVGRGGLRARAAPRRRRASSAASSAAASASSTAGAPAAVGGDDLAELGVAAPERAGAGRRRRAPQGPRAAARSRRARPAAARRRRRSRSSGVPACVRACGRALDGVRAGRRLEAARPGIATAPVDRRPTAPGEVVGGRLTGAGERC